MEARTHCHLTIDAPPQGTPANVRIYLIFLETRIIDLHFATDSMGLSSFRFLCWTPWNFYCWKSDVLTIQGHQFW